jgi:aryl-alcohol dehydrogenase-like predicted oxidoreductase
MAELSKYQQSIVKNYYANLDTALLQRLGEQVTDLYLAEGKKRDKVWASVVTSLTKLGVPKPRIDQLHKSDDARKLATLLQELLAKD